MYKISEFGSHLDFQNKIPKLFHGPSVIHKDDRFMKNKKLKRYAFLWKGFIKKKKSKSDEK